MELPVVNHSDYVAKIKDDNKFPIKKFGELAKYLLENKVVKKFYNPKPCSFNTLKVMFKCLSSSLVIFSFSIGL